MITFNNSIVLPSTLTASSCTFDATFRTLVFRNRDIRDVPTIEYTLNGNKYIGSFDTDLSYSLPSIDTLYTLIFTGIPKKDQYKGFSGSLQIFKNHPECKDFIYGDKTSTVISGYKGTNKTITVPNKYNMRNLTEVNITSFPNVSGNISITIEDEINSFWIKDSKIREMTIKSPDFYPIEEQFSELDNLLTINKNNDWISIPNRCFYNCSKLRPDDEFFKYTTNLGVDSFTGTTIPTLKFAGNSTLNSGLENVVVFTSADNLNDKDEKSLYDNPTTDTITEFVGVNDAAWSTEGADDSAYIVPRGIANEYGVEIDGVEVPYASMLLACSDPNIIGYKFRLLSNFGDSADLMGYGVHIPQGITQSYQEDYVTIVDGRKYFILNVDLLENDNTEGALSSGDNIIEISAFDRNGYKSTVIRKRRDGADKPTFVTNVAFFTTQDNTTLTLNGEVFETNVPAGRLYLYGDMFNIPKFKLEITDKGYNNTWPFMTADTASINLTKDASIRWIDVSQYVNIDAILNSGISWSTLYEDLEDFYLHIYNADASGNTMVGNPAGTAAHYYTLGVAKTSFSY